MFEDLDFVHSEIKKKDGNVGIILYRNITKDEEGSTVQKYIYFDLDEKKYGAYISVTAENTDVLEIDISLSKAIIRQQEEKGWL